MTAFSTLIMLFPVTRYVGSALPVIMSVGIVKEEESGNVDAVMDGALDSFINAYLKWIHRPPQEA